MDVATAVEKLNMHLRAWIALEAQGVVLPEFPSITYSSLNGQLIVELPTYERTISISTMLDESGFLQIVSSDNLMSNFFEPIKNQLRAGIANAFYLSNYEVVFEHSFASRKDRFLQSKILGCRFCGEQNPAVFQMNAHAIPDSTGNKSLFTRYECDDCNQNFGRGIDNHFGQWTNPSRTISGIPGKDGVPGLGMKKGQIRHANNLTKIEVRQKGLIEVPEGTTQVNLCMTRPTFVPVAVLKCFYKMALAVMPDDEMPKFKAIVNWVRADQHQEPPAGVRYSVLEAFCTAPASTVGGCVLMRRKTPDTTKPYMTFFLSFGQFAYQIAIASPEEQPNTLLTFIPLAFLLSDLSLARTYIFQRELNGSNPIKGESMEATLFITKDADNVVTQLRSML